MAAMPNYFSSRLYSAYCASVGVLTEFLNTKIYIVYKLIPVRKEPSNVSVSFYLDSNITECKTRHDVLWIFCGFS